MRSRLRLQARSIRRNRSSGCDNCNLRSPNTLRGIPPLYPGEEEDTGRQLILEPAPRQRWDWINAAVDTQYFYTSNAYLTSSKATGTGLLVSTIDAELAAPPISLPYGKLFATAGFEYQWFDYGLGGSGGNVSDLDFDAETIYVEAQYQLPDQWSVFGNLSYTRLLNDGNGFDEFYRELVPSLRFEKTFQIRRQLQASLEYSADYRFTDEAAYPEQGTGCNNRTDQVLDFDLIWQITPKLLIRPFYRFQYSYYPDYFAGQSRNDFLNTVGVSAYYCFNAWSSVRLFLDYEVRNSDAVLAPDYHKLDAGGGVSVGLKF